MAMPSTARRSEPHSGRFRADMETPRSPLSPRQPSRPSTPRPSISPLSTASKAAKSSPIPLPDLSVSDVTFARPVCGDGLLDPEAAETADQRDDRSSSLSEPEDEPDDDMLQNGIGRGLGADDERSGQLLLEVDSEAETERLDQTPHRLRKHADSIGKTPSKLNQAAVIDDDLSDPPSPLLAGPGPASSTSTIATAGPSPQISYASVPNIPIRTPADGSNTGQKRKRSNTDVSSLTSAGSEFDESPRKRSHGSPEEENADDETVTADGIETEVVETAETISRDLERDEERETPVLPTKGGRGRKGKPKAKLKKESTKDPEPESVEENPQIDEDQSVENTGKTVEEVQHKTEASVSYEDLAKQFTALRERLYSERLSALTSELDMLNQPVCKHPEYLRQIACVDARYGKQVGEVQALYRYKNDTLRRSTLGERASLHCQYFQYTRELREDILTKLGDDWYNIQKERRQSNQANDEAYIARFATKKSVQIRHQAKYNQEVSVLSGVAKYVGFPAAPEITGAPPDQLDDDLKAMKINKRIPPPPPPTQQQVPFLTFGNGTMAQTSDQIQQNERLAHEQFIEQNAWARPQGTIHTHGTPNLTYSADWAEPVAHNSKHMIRNLSGGINHVSPYSTPVTQRRLPAEHSSAGTVAMNSDPIEPPSSVQAAPPTIERLHQHYHPGNTSPLSISKSRQPILQNGTVDPTGGGRENSRDAFRNISGTSTIDAPPDSQSMPNEKDAHNRSTLPRHLPISAFSAAAPSSSLDASAPHSVFETSQLPRHGNPTGGLEDQQQQRMAAELYPSHPGFRPRDGTFGTPAPFGGSTATATVTTTTTTSTNGS